MAATATENRSRVIAALLGIAGLFVVLYRSAQKVVDTDAGFDLAIGRLIDRGQLPSTNALAWTAADHPWYPTAWLYDWALFRSEHLFGPVGVQLVVLALSIVTALGLFAALRETTQGEDDQPSPWWMAVFAATLLLLAPRIGARSYLVTWAALAWTVALCERARRLGWRWRVAALPVLAIASNGHAGAAFSAGVLALYGVESAVRERAWMREAAIAALGVGAVMLNPGGWTNLVDLFAHLRVQDLVSIAEYRPPEPTSEPAFFLLLLPLLPAAWIARDRPATALMAIAFAVMGLRNVRFAYEFFLAAAPLWALAVVRLKVRRGSMAALAIGASSLAAAVQATPHLGATALGAGFAQDGLPVRAARFIQREGLTGRFYNAYHDGGYLAYALDQPIFQDGRPRAWPASFWAANEAADQSAAAFEAWLRSLEVEWAVTARYPTPMTGEGRLADDRWALVYWDDVNEVRLRRDVPKFAAQIERLEYRYFRRSLDPYRAIVMTIEQGTDEVLAAYEKELDRFEADSPGDSYATIARCYLARRKNAPAPNEACSLLP